MEIRPIRTRDDLNAASARIEALWEAPSGTPEGDELEILMELAEAYEKRAFPDLPPDPIEAIKCMLEMKGMTVADLTPVMPRNRAYEVLNYKRPLSINMMRGLHDLLGIPLDCLAKPYELKGVPKAG